MKKILMVLAIAGFSTAAMAQSAQEYEDVGKHRVLTNKFDANWFISFGGGGEILFGNSDVHADFGDRISPTFNLAVGKWFTPGLGLRMQYSGFQGRGVTRNANNHYVSGTMDSDGFYKQKFNYMNLHGDILFNLSSMIGGYNPDRVYEFIPYLGAGFTYNYDKPHAKGFALNGGIINRFRLSSAWDLNLELSFTGTHNKFDGEGRGSIDADGIGAATIGFTYKFPKRTFDKPKAATQLISEAELRNLRNRMNEMNAENQQLRNELADARKPVTVVEHEIIEADFHPRSVFFKINSSVINDAELMNLGYVAEQMKDHPTLKYTVTGYADSATGTPQINQRLSEERAKAVVDVLVNTHGISRDRFVSVQGMGGVMKFGKAHLNRMTLIEMAK